MILIPCFWMQQRDYHECNQYRMHPGWFWTDPLKGLRARRVARRCSTLFYSKLSAATFPSSLVCRVLKERKKKRRKKKGRGWQCWIFIMMCKLTDVFRWYASFAATTTKVADYFVFIYDLWACFITCTFMHTQNTITLEERLCECEYSLTHLP